MPPLREKEREEQRNTHIHIHNTYIYTGDMTAVLENGLPANGTNGVNGNVDQLANPTPSHPAFDSIPDVIQAFGTLSFASSS